VLSYAPTRHDTEATLSITADEVEVARIISGIRESLRPRLATVTAPFAIAPPRSVDIDAEAGHDLVVLHSGWNIANFPITSHRKVIGFFIVLGKKIMRLLMVPALHRQIVYNQANTRTVQRLKDDLDHRVTQDIDELRRSFTARLEALEAELDRRTVSARMETGSGPAGVLDGDERYGRYVDLFAGRAPVLDIGCGRREVVERAHAAGLEAIAAEVSLDELRVCREGGIDPLKLGVFSALEAAGDAALGAVFAARLLEHLPAEAIVAFTRLCHRKLASDGLLVLEVRGPVRPVSPSQLAAAWPYHPFSLDLLLRAAGFDEVRTGSWALTSQALGPGSASVADGFLGGVCWVSGRKSSADGERPR
jgi:hypothetical protein